MGEKIRKSHIGDFEPLMRFLERSYGHRRNFFSENYGYLLKDVFGAEEAAPKGSYILEKNGKIISHVGLYPLNLVSDGIRITAGGIGNVATAPEARGRGCMGKLLSRAVSDMKKGGVFLSVLWGDRHRYGNFGWETGGEKFNLTLTPRSIGKSGAGRVKDVEEADPGTAARDIRKFHGNFRFRADRGRKMKGIISRQNNRVWLSGDGYLCGTGVNGLRVNEVYSSSGNEAGMILACMRWASHSFASVYVPPGDDLLLARLLPAASSWEIVPEGVFRVNDPGSLLRVFAPALEKRAGERKLKDFSVSLKIRRPGGDDNLTVSLASGKLEVDSAEVKRASPVAEKDAVRLMLGGPAAMRPGIEPLGAILPLPVHIPLLDHV